MMTRISSAMFVLVCAAALLAQTFRGGIQGTVTDSSGAVIAGADISVTNPATGFSRTTKSNDTGNYFVSELPIGAYDLSVSAKGFRPATVKAIKVEVSSSQQINVSLSPGQVSETVVVTEQSPLIDTTQDTLGATLEAEHFNELPVSGRDFTKLLVMVPGSGGDPSGVADSPGSFGLFSINGNRGRSNNYLLDGTDMNDGYRNLPAINQGGVFGTPATILPMDALQEVSVVNSTEAEFGRSSGATVNIVTKSGTNNFHGSVYEYFRNSALDARNFFNTKPAPQDQFHNNQFGFSAGGPFKRDKTFWFVAYEGQREGVGIPTLAHVPTAADIAAATAANGGVVNPVIASLLARNPWPAPNQAPDVNGNNLLASTRANNRVDSVIGKVDHRFSENDNLTGRYYFGDSDQSFPLALVGGGILPGFNTVTPTNVNILSLSHTHIFSPTLLTEIRFGYNRFHETFSPQDSTFDPSTIGLNTGVGAQDFGLPQISVGGFATLGANTSVPRGRTDTNWQFFDNFSWVRGRHNWKFGYEFRRTFVDGFFDSGYRGKLSFDDLTAFIAGTPSSGRQAQGNSSRQTFQNNQSLYLQDNFRLSSRVTLTYGLRWEYFGVIGEEKNRFSLFDAATASVNTVKQLYPKDLNNFAPRASVAWDLRGDSRTVLRAGWGMYYDAFSQDFFVGQLPFNTFNSGPAYNGVGPDPITFSFSPTTTLAPGAPVFDPASFSAADVFTVDQKIRTPYIHVFNLNLQQELSRNVALQIGYVGSQGRKLFRYVDINQINPATGTAAFPAFEFINNFQSSASSSYHSLQTSLTFRNWHRLTSTVNYTWSHSIDNASDGQDYVPNATQPDNSFRPDLERASSNFDMRQHLSWTFNYQVPEWGENKWLSRGWSIDGVLALAAGQPFNVNYLFEGDFNGSGEFFGRPDLVGNPFAGTSTPNSFLNLTAFQVPCTFNGDPANPGCNGNQHFGNLGRNAFVGPDFKNFDFSLVKDTNLTEKLKMQVRLDVFNLFNHPNFANPLWPNFGVDFAQNGFDAAGHGVGFLPITTTPDVGVGNPFLGGGGSRNLQLAARFSF
ncbi:MAG TPA: TonB-dependent receptor [Candidatus Limnocylindrales bacterium]|nr:TonB-dependent receptor [Candidatus Limnocylindrales bacterium]